MEKVMEYILQVDTCGSFSKAAEALFISQPALSAIIRKEEQRLNLTLFDRSVKPVRPTYAGTKYLEAAKKIRRIETALYKELACSTSQSSEIIIGSSAFFFASFVNQLIEGFKQQHPQLRFKCLEYSTEQALKLLQKKELDLVITAHNSKIKGCSATAIKRENIVLAVPAAYEVNSHLASYALTLGDINSGEWLKDGFPCVPLSFFTGYPFILHKKSKDMYKRAIRMFNNKNMHPNIIGQIEDFYTLYFLARSGQGIVFLRDSLLKYIEPTPKLAFYKLDDGLAARDINIYYKKDCLDEARQSFIDFCVAKKHM